MNALAPLLDLCLYPKGTSFGAHTGLSSLGNTHRYTARSENLARKQISDRREGCRQTSRGSTLGVQLSLQFMNSPDQETRQWH